MIKDSYEDMVRTDNRIVLFLGALFAVFILSMAFVSATSITDGIEAYYKLDETTGLTATDFSGNGNNGTMEGYTFNHGVINGGVTIEDEAMAFNGTTGYIDLGDSNAFSTNNNQITWNFWVYKYQDIEDGTILGKFSTTASQREYIIKGSASDNLRIYVSNEGTSADYSNQQLNGTSFDANVWTNFAIVFNGDENRIYNYKNGSLVGTNTNSVLNKIFNSTTPLYIGNSVSSTGVYEGKIDSVQIYNRALTSDEITAQYNAGRGSYALSGDGLVAQYSGRDYNATHILDTNPVVEGATENTVYGKRFDGIDDYVDTGLVGNDTTNFSIGVWVKRNGTATAQRIISSQETVVQSFSISTTGRVAYLIRDSKSVLSNITVDLADALVIGEWTYISGTFDGTTQRLYLNGSLKKSATPPFTGNFITTNPFLLGRLNLTSGEYFNGSIDEVGIWSRALTQDEITYLYESSPHAQTTFESEQVSGTTDTNITLTCTAINGCKTINYNINNKGWIELIDSKNLTHYFNGTEQIEISSAEKGYILFYTITGLTDGNIINTLNAKLNLKTASVKATGLAKLRYNYSDSTYTESDVVSQYGSQYATKTFSIMSDTSKKLSSIEVYGAIQESPESYIYIDDLNIGYNSYLMYNHISSSFLYSGAGDHNIQYFSTDNADNNETIKLSYFPMFKSENELSNSRIKLTGVTWYNGYEITSWQYQVNGTPLSGTSDRIKYYSTQSNEDLNVCLTTNSTDTICKSVLTWDTINPIIDANIQTSGYGFTNTFDINYNLTCNDNFPFITYKVILINNGTTTILDEQYLTTGTLLQGTLDLNAGQEATLTFTCTDASNNQATYTAPTQYAIQFNIVDETTGLPFDLTKVTHAQAYTYDGNYLFNFKDTNNATQTYWSPTSVIRFDFTYPDEAQTKISREIDFDYITDANVPVCAAEYQQFYLYRFLSTTEKPIILHNDFANCYSLASTTKFLWTTYLTNTAYTINKPYYLYTYSNGVKSLLAILDGANNTEINLDILQFNQAQYQFDVSSDSIVFRPGENDSNTIVFYFFSPNNNTWVNLEIYDQSNNLLWDYLENTDTNSFQVTFFYGDLDINSDDLLKIVITVLNDGEETSFFKYFNTKGEAYAGLLNPIVAIVLSFFVLFFGITMVSYRFAMGWFGIVISFLAIGILALAPLYDYILFLMAIYFIIGLFIGLIGREQTLGVN